jgi:hypothetical protein
MIARGDHDASLTVAQLIANLGIDWKRQKLPQIGIPVREVRP